MPINFFQIGCKTESNQHLFGLCDNPPPATDPAYIDEIDSTKWIAEVTNNLSVNVEFFAVDHCPAIQPVRPNNEPAKRCDGILKHNNKLSFVELKDRDHRGWISGGRKQITETIQFFIASHDITVYANVDAYVSNKQRPLAVIGSSSEVQKFKDETALMLNNTGILLQVNRTILI